MPIAHTLIYHRDGRIEAAAELPEDPRLKATDERLLWLDVQDPTAADVELLRQKFGFHELALEDVIRSRQRPKIDEYPGYYFAIFYATRADSLQELGFFIGPHYLVTTHRGPVPEIETLVTRLRQHREGSEVSVGMLVYGLLDAVVDAYFPFVDALAERVERLERSIFDGVGGYQLNDVFELKRDLLHLRRTLAPQRDLLNALLHRDRPVFGESMIVYFQDIYDHVIRVLDSIDLYRDQLSSLLDAHLSVASNRLNTVMKRMTALSTILMTMALITGVYGMNFRLMPELDWSLGYAWALALMAVVGAILGLIFKRIDWL